MDFLPGIFFGELMQQLPYAASAVALVSPESFPSKMDRLKLAIPHFEKHCPKDRKNFLSYSYCLFKFFQLLGYDEFLDSFTLLYFSASSRTASLQK